MAYGAEFRNAAGDLIVDNGFALYERQRGFTHKPSNIDETGVPGEYGLAFPLPTHFINFGGTVFKGRFVSNGSERVTTNLLVNGRYSAYVVPDQLWDYGDMAFYRLADGKVFFYLAIGHKKGAVEGTFHFLIHDQTSSEIEYRMASVTPGSVPSEGYGLQTFNEVGEVVFDSRHKQLPVLVNLYVSAAQINSVISTGATIDLPLGMDIPDAWIATPQWTSFYNHYTGSGYNSSWNPTIIQIADDTLRLQRINTPGNTRIDNGLRDPDFNSFTHDATILVAPPPAT